MQHDIPGTGSCHSDAAIVKLLKDRGADPGSYPGRSVVPSPSVYILVLKAPAHRHTHLLVHDRS